MFNSWIHPKAHLYLHIVGMTLIAVGLPLNKVVMSVGTIWIFANWLIELDFSSKWSRFKSNKLVWGALLLFILHLIGLIWTEDWSYGLRDLEKKLPLFVLPLVCGTREELKKKDYWIILYGFLLSLLITSVINFSTKFGEHINNYRDISLFGSHIRYALLVNFGVFISFIGMLKKRIPIFLGIILFSWLVYYIFYSWVSSGILIFIVLCMISGLYGIFRLKYKWLNISLGILLITSVSYTVFTSISVWDDVQPKNDCSDLPLLTAKGNPYSHLVSYKFYERGYQLLLFVNEPEMEAEWSKLSETPFNLEIHEDYFFKHQLIRYLTSKGLTKDAAGVSSLTKDDIINLENGMSTVIDLKNPLERKLYHFFSEYILYENGVDPNGHSSLQRLQHLQTGWLIFKEHPIIGVGTGDVQKAFDEMYERESSNLSKDHRLRAHSQILTFMIAFGFLGGIILLLVVLLPLFYAKKEFLQVVFIGAVICSFLFSDLLESQVGVTFFALFYSLLNLSLPRTDGFPAIE